MEDVLRGVEGVQEDVGGQDEAEVEVGPGEAGSDLPLEGGVPVLLDHRPASEGGGWTELLNEVGESLSLDRFWKRENSRFAE